MIDTLIDAVSTVCLLGGGAFGVIGGIGLMRFPDFYSRLHAGGVTDTLSALLIVVGLVLQSGISLLSLKLLLVLLFLLFTTPTASHALAQAALTAGVPLVRGRKGDDKEEPPSST